MTPMIESLRTTQVASFRFATLCGFFRGSADKVQKVSKGSCKRKSYETICENIVSRYQTLVSSLPREAVFRRRRPKVLPKVHFMTGPHRQPSNEYRQEAKTVTCYSKAQCKHGISHVPNFIQVLNA